LEAPKSFKSFKRDKKQTNKERLPNFVTSLKDREEVCSFVFSNRGNHGKAHQKRITSHSVKIAGSRDAVADSLTDSRKAGDDGPGKASED